MNRPARRVGRKQRTRLGGRRLRRGAEGDEVRDLQTMLARFGYLRGAYTPGVLCECTERALRRYQRFFHLEPDGVVGEQTRRALVRPRCGVPDLFPINAAASVSGNYELIGCAYTRRHLTYAIQNHPEDLSPGATQASLATAFGVWAAVADLRFEQVGPDDAADFVIGWHLGDHGDGEPFDALGGPSSNVVGHAFFPPPCGGSFAGALHFDAAETWTTDTWGDGLLLLQVAIHEIGHLLGLKHSQEEASIMFPSYEPGKLSLHADDVAAIQALYGTGAARALTLAGDDAGRLAGTGDIADFVVAVPKQLIVSIEGPADADFDVYVRRDHPVEEEAYDFGAWTMSANERLSFPIDGAAESYHIRVHSYTGGGDFTIRVEGSR